MIPVGITLQPDHVYLDLLHDVIREDADYYEVAPETLWHRDSSGRLVPNGFHRAFRELAEKTSRPFVAHGVGLSMGSLARDDERLKIWLDCIRADHDAFDFCWYTDHLGMSAPAGHALSLPLPVPMTADRIEQHRNTLGALQGIVGDVGVENSVFYFHLGDPLDEPAFLRRILDGDRRHLLLDLHNVYTTAKNVGFDPLAYIERLNLDDVIEIHLSGGQDSPPDWLESGRSLRLDSHDAAVPEEVWALFDAVWPHCRNLRGVTLERMEGTITVPDVAIIREELGRIRQAVSR